MTNNSSNRLLSTISETLYEVLIASDKEGLIGDIPIFGSFYKAAKVSKSVSDRLFLLKLATFIEDINSLTDKDLTCIKDTLESESNSDLAEKLLLVIDNLTETEKSKYMAQALTLYSRSELTKSHFLRSLDLIQKMYIGDLNAYAESHWILNCSSEDLESMDLNSLIGTPILKVQNIDPKELRADGRESEIGITKFEETRFGKIFRDVLNNKEPYSEMGKDHIKKRGSLLSF